MKNETADITRLGYTPSGRRLDVEVFPFSDIVRRSNPSKVRATHRYEFHLLVLVTEGTPTQIVDFELVQCAPGSILVLRPGQVHSFGVNLNWEGWLVLFRSEFVPTVSDVPSDLVPGRLLDRMPGHMVLGRENLRATTEAIVTMAEDSRGDAPADVVHTLLRHQLCTLVLRLNLLTGQQSAAEIPRSPTLKRFARFRDLLEGNFVGWHQVGPYADALSCTQKSLNRATRDVPLSEQTATLNPTLDSREVFDFVYQILDIAFGLMPVVLVCWLLWSARRPHLGRLGLRRGCRGRWRPWAFLSFSAAT